MIRQRITHRATLETIATELPQWLDPAQGVIKELVTL